MICLHEVMAIDLGLKVEIDQKFLKVITAAITRHARAGFHVKNGGSRARRVCLF